MQSQFCYKQGGLLLCFEIELGCERNLTLLSNEKHDTIRTHLTLGNCR